MRVFLDFEASSLAKDSYPIEVAWVFEDGRSEGYLILPAPAWTDWDEGAEAVHRITRAELVAEGTPHDVVARRMLEALAGHTVYASAPSWDGKWLSTLLRTAGLPRHALRLKDTEEALLETAIEALRGVVADEELLPVATTLVKSAQAAAEQQTVAHRALADAERERQTWLEVGRLAREEAMRRARDA
ncbi:MAG TPA: transcriptional regulator [Arsenicitalea sp.]|jgi:hypothetical protein|nr:transcriptional regulator [Arsenicitalea sp.]